MNISHWFAPGHLLAICAAALAAASYLPAARAADLTAEQMMKQAHDGREVWNDFRGFSADIVASTEGQSVRGKVTVDAKGNVTLDLNGPGDTKWIQRTLDSIVSHRMADGSAVTGVQFADDDKTHPLGRLIRSTDATERSLWRAKGDVLTEVHRDHGKARFIISVTEVTRTKNGKHLPRHFTVTTWNNETNAIQTARQVYNDWVQVGDIQLPTKLLAAVSKADGTRTVECIELTGHTVPRTTAAKVSVRELPPLKSPVTSFGAAIAGDNLYVYGGHLGSPHKYSAEDQSNHLLRLNLAKPDHWEIVGEVPRRTGLAMVAYQGKLYRVGGWESRNAAGEKWNLFSQSDFASFDPQTGKWTQLASLPQGRSSHDAALIGSKLFVVGGWELQGEGEGTWHDTAFVCDLADAQPKWKEIAKPPFMRRAVAVAGHNGKLYVIGGMNDSNETTTAMSVYDPQSNVWTEGPEIPGKGFDGFGASAFAANGSLFVTTGSGTLARLSEDGSNWEEVDKLAHPRFFHRMLATDDGQLVLVGGTSRKSGKVSEVEAIRVDLAAAAE